ncbi:hypothetical protein PpSQ1_23150, partial [Pseudomonas putida]
PLPLPLPLPLFCFCFCFSENGSTGTAGCDFRRPKQQQQQEQGYLEMGVGRARQQLTTCHPPRSLAASRFFGQAEAKTGTRYKPRLPPQL